MTELRPVVIFERVWMLFLADVVEFYYYLKASLFTVVGFGVIDARLVPLWELFFIFPPADVVCKQVLSMF